MATRKKTSARPNPVTKALAHLDKRVTILELGMAGIGASVKRLDDEVSILKQVVKGIDERTIRGEKLMMEMQGDQRKMMRLLEGIAASVHRTDKAVEDAVAHVPTEPREHG